VPDLYDLHLCLPTAEEGKAFFELAYGLRKSAPAKKSG
jgi:hypothetical protein